MSIFGEEIRKARKPHRCYWCGETIEPDTQYARWISVDGALFVVTVHIDCQAAWQSLDWIDRDTVEQYSYSRGCTCERGRCSCVKERT
jgi:hypothetical protein